MMEVGRDSYVTVAEADDYVAIHCPEAAAAAWSGKAAEQKERELKNACRDIEGLPFPGQAKADQPLSFPRVPGTAVPEEIKAAQIEIALLPFTENSADADSASRRLMLRRQGVKSFSIGDLSESYVGIAEELSEHPFLQNGKIARLLSRYLKGAYDTC